MDHSTQQKSRPRSISGATVLELSALLFSGDARGELFRAAGRCVLAPGLTLDLSSANEVRLTWRAKHGIRLNSQQDMLIECVRLGQVTQGWTERAAVLGNFVAYEPKDGKQVLDSAFLQGLMKQGFRIARLENLAAEGLRVPLSLADTASFQDCRLSLATILSAKTLNLTRVTFDDAHVEFQVQQGTWASVALRGKKSVFSGFVGTVQLDGDCEFRDCSIRADFRHAHIDPKVRTNSAGYSMTTGLYPEWLGKGLVPMEAGEVEARLKVTQAATFKDAGAGAWHEASDRAHRASGESAS